VDTFWTTFLPQLVATVVGGLIGAAAAITAVERGFRLQRAAERDDRAHAAAAALMVELARYADAKEQTLAWGSFGAHRGDPPPPKPSRNAVSIAVETLVMSTQGEDREIARLVSNAWSSIRSAKGDVIGGVGVLAGAVAAWRTGDRTGKSLRSHIHTAEELAIDGITIGEDDNS